jgi:hypothetical protein
MEINLILLAFFIRISIDDQILFELFFKRFQVQFQFFCINSLLNFILLFDDDALDFHSNLEIVIMIPAIFLPTHFHKFCDFFIVPKFIFFSRRCYIVSIVVILILKTLRLFIIYYGISLLNFRLMIA